ncbi:MAG: ribosome biogenesis GTP-binding protein YihA/YsxC [Gammaproteobacteria bacterium]|nr:ribosome biogenesis GTP-binding protein YihA/YsxC [Gammaproteobacteria bacterium]
MSLYPDARFLISAFTVDQFVPDTGAEVAFAGRSNAGKSSAINAIVNRRGFARTSKSPGRTQLINFFALAPDQRLVDLPGYGYARVSRALQDHWRGLLVDYFEHRQSLAGLLLVVDSRRLLGDFDWQMLDWCRDIDCPVHVLLTKADKLKREAAAKALTQVRRELEGIATVQLFSALKSQGIDTARSRLQEFLEGGQKEASDAEYRGTSEANSTGLG